MYTGLIIGRRYHTIINSGHDFIQQREATNQASWYNPINDKAIDVYYNKKNTAVGTSASNLDPHCLTVQLGKDTHTINADQTTIQLAQKIDATDTYINVYLHWSTTYQLVGFTVAKVVSGTSTVLYTIGTQTEYTDEVQISCTPSLYVSSDVTNSAHIAFSLIIQKDWSYESGGTTYSYKGWILRVGMYKTYDTSDISYFTAFEPIKGTVSNYLPSSIDLVTNSWGATAKSMGETCTALTSCLTVLESLGFYKSITAVDFSRGIVETTRDLISKLFPKR